MDNSKSTDLDIESKRKRLRFRAWHRGTKEMDLLMGSFVDTWLSEFGDIELAELEKIIDYNDIDLYAWLTGRQPIPANVDSELMQKLKAHSQSNISKPNKSTLDIQ